MSNRMDNRIKSRRTNRILFLVLLLFVLLALFLLRSLWESVPASEPPTVSDVGGQIDEAVAPPTVDQNEIESASPTIPTFNWAGETPEGFSLLGTGEAGATLNVLIDGELENTVLIDDEGVWRIDMEVPAAGSYLVEMQLLDEAGLVVATNQRPLEVPELLANSDEPEASEVADADSSQLVEDELPATDPAPEEVTEPEQDEVSEEVVATAESAETPESEVEPTEGSSEESAEIEPTETPLPPAVTNQPTLETPDLSGFIGGIVPLRGTGDPNSTLEIIVDDGIEPSTETITVDEDGTWVIGKWLTTPADYTITAQAQGNSEGAPSFSFNIPEVNFAFASNCLAGFPPFGTYQGDTYIMAPCEYLALVAKRVGVTYQALLDANPAILNPNVVQAGTVINLPPHP